VSETATTSVLAAFAAEREPGDYPAEVAHAARRTIANAVALSAAAAKHPAAQRALGVVLALAGSEEATVLGTSTRLPVQWAALVNGLTAHVEDFDDTHLQTVIHPGAPIVPAALAAAELVDASGAQLLDAVVLGMEVALRIGVGVGPGHFDRGWHVTGTAGHFGAAVAAARLTGLGAAATAAALGIAGTQAAGLQAALGSMTKAFHPGKAAADGVEAALLAGLGLTAPLDVVEGRRGFGEVMAPTADYGAMTEGLGERWETARNSFKPYACGIVSHPALDAAIALRDRVGDVSAIEEIVARVHPVVLDVMGVKDPVDGLQSKFSVYHCVAVGILDGAGSLVQFTDARATDPAVRRLRSLVRAESDITVAKDATHVSVRLADGSTLVQGVEHARGSEHRPLTDAELADKAGSLIGRDAGDAHVERLMECALGVDRLDRLDGLLRAAADFGALAVVDLGRS
jgi:2-methylcitrate dehydratase PrpD